MTESKESAKATKARLKTLKKQVQADDPARAQSHSHREMGESPAERSAATAERQLIVRKRQLWVSIAGMAIAQPVRSRL